ncbi:MAG TPA: hypothetical protein VGN01_07520 [Acidobacteriaceae bacterium]|jgi:uncharacterized membrane protein YeaQ/YmgE (transglycosylase-associated protein family)
MIPRRRLLPVFALSTLLAAAPATQAQARGSWMAVQHLPTGQRIRVHTPRRYTVCTFDSADDDSLICTQHRIIIFVPVNSSQVFRRSEVQSVKLSRQGASTLAGTAIGLGAGVGIGAAIDATAKDQAEEGHIMTVVLGLLGALLGEGIGNHTDFLAGPVMYQAP